MPKELTKTIHFFEVYKHVYQEPVEDTLQTDTTGTDTTAIQQDTTLQAEPAEVPDTIHQQDTTELPEQVVEQQDTTEVDTTVVDTLVSEADTSLQAPAQPQPQVQVSPQEQPQATDTLADLYDIFGVTELPISNRLEKDPAHHNFLYNIPEARPEKNQKAGKIYQPSDKSIATTEKEVDKITEIPIDKSRQSDYDWLTFVLIASFLLIGWTRLFFSKYFMALIKSFHSYNYASSLYYGKNSLTIRASTLLNFTFFITAGTFLFQVLNHYDVNVSRLDPVIQFLLLPAFFFAWYIWNYLTTGFIGFVFLRQQSFQEYFHNYNLYRKILGIALFPVILVLQYISPEYKPEILLIGSIVFGIFYFTHILRGLFIFIKKNVSIFYLILYLCALEFLPLVVLYGVFIRGL
jgi:hypothetical protein